MSTTRPPDIRLNRYMYKGYETLDTPVERETHDPDQWREQRTSAECQEAMPIQNICGWQAKRFLGDLQDRK